MTYGTLDGMALLEPASVSLSAWVRGSPSERHDLREVYARGPIWRRSGLRAEAVGAQAGGRGSGAEAVARRRALAQAAPREVVARIPAGDAEKIAKALELLEEFRIRAVLTGVYEGWTLPDAIGRSRATCVFRCAA